MTHRTYRSIGWVIISKVAKISPIRSIDISLNIEIFISQMAELLLQKVARLLNEKVMFVFTTQEVKRIQNDPPRQGSILNKILSDYCVGLLLAIFSKKILLLLLQISSRIRSNLQDIQSATTFPM